MKFFNFYSSVVFCLALCLCGCEQENTETRLKTKFEYVDESFDVNSWKTENQKFDRINIGGTKINIPPPRGFVNGTETFLGEALVSILGMPTYIDYLQYFKPKDIAAILDDDFAEKWENDYTFFNVRTLREVEYHDAKPNDLNDAKETSHGGTTSGDKLRKQYLEKYRDGVSRNLKDLEIIDSENDFGISDIKTLPIHDESKYHYSWVTYTRSHIAGDVDIEIGIMTIILIKNRLFYLIAVSNNTDSKENLKSIMYDWSRSTISAN